MAKQQCQVLDREYPSSPALVKIALGQTSRRRLWWRRPADPDFLSLRMGTGSGRASFSVSLPKISDPNEPLIALAQDLINAFQEVQGLPSLLDLKKAGSLAIASKSDNNLCDFTRRLILDLIIHHSPQDVQVVALSDTEEGRALFHATNQHTVMQRTNLHSLVPLL